MYPRILEKPAPSPNIKYVHQYIRSLMGNIEYKEVGALYELESKLLVSPLRIPIILPYMTPFKESRLWLIYIHRDVCLYVYIYTHIYLSIYLYISMQGLSSLRIRHQRACRFPGMLRRRYHSSGLKVWKIGGAGTCTYVMCLSLYQYEKLCKYMYKTNSHYKIKNT